MPSGRVARPEAVRFFEKVKITETCWEWTGTKVQGYGWFTQANKKTIGAHLWLYKQKFGPLTEGKELDHLCRNRKCVNLSHLELVTKKENILRGISPPAINARKTHCINGHEFTEKNTYKRKNEAGKRCRTCMHVTGKRRRKKIKDEKRNYHR